ncbi:hypothetical protein WR25_01035 [Diploscapter pachys]|uniref:Kinesin motor domain-containing protein n=1 Tax=Diploscapter pachys TaxID=2018661 RepID=A0A2A2JSZ4_9BILA|nr:hypothetical protein WR25_01035 [Diploscapter pachys]
MATPRDPSSASVQVALRIRPQIDRERAEGSRVCTSVTPGEPQISLGTDRAFTFDFVFDQPTPQRLVYENCAEKLVNGLFEGFNATVLAYGQTGSGKTFTMGTAIDAESAAMACAQNDDDENKENESQGNTIGVIPRAIAHLFKRTTELRREAAEAGRLEPSFDVAVQFIELYNEEIIDLLADDRSSSLNVKIQEDSRGEIYLHGAASKTVTDLHSTLEMLKNGALNRTVASTKMNEQSSRSHAIFSIFIKQQRVATLDSADSHAGEVEMEVLSAKFHFVDLAGSERLKRTGATGDRAKEGISINCGLLALGNVISALGGASGKVSHVPYRDSKLTRLLQDSLGGNSRTLMIACVSPSDCDFVETLNTLKYANRAKNIKNKIVANQDKSSKVVAELRGRIAALEAELLEYKQGKRMIGEDGLEVVNDMCSENLYLNNEINQLRFRVKALQETNEILRNRNVDLMAKAASGQLGYDRPIIVKGNNTSDTINGNEFKEGESPEEDAVQTAVRGYLHEMEHLRSALYESQATNDQLRKERDRWRHQASSAGIYSGSILPINEPSFGVSQSQIIEEAKREIEQMRKQIANSATSDYASTGEGEDDDRTSNDADELEDEEDENNEAYAGEKECAALKNNLADVQSEINIKEKLIFELEKSERRLAEVRMTYEKKLAELSLRIQQTEAERDRILAENTVKGKGGGVNVDKAAEEKAKGIRAEYEKRLSEMRAEFKKLQSVEREHKRMQERQEKERMELMKYKGELTELKKVKVDLMKKINEEMKKAQQQQMANSKKIMSLDKEARKRENLIRNLQNKDRQREDFMKRKVEELEQLRRQQREQNRAARSQNQLSARSGPINSRTLRNRPTPMFNPRHAKIKWTLIEKKLAKLVVQKQTVGEMESELERLIGERARLTAEISKLEKNFIATDKDLERYEIGDELDSARDKLKYIEEQMTETQKAIAQIDNDNDEEESGLTGIDIEKPEALLQSCNSVEEARYLLQHLFNHCVEQATATAKAENSNKSYEARIQQLEQQASVSEQLLSTVIADRDIDSEHLQSTPKARRRTATTDELLYPSETVSPRQSLIQPQISPIQASETKSNISDEDLSSARKEKKKMRQGRMLTSKGVGSGKVVVRTHTLDGHNKAVLSVASSENMLLSGSKDRTAKLWDLQNGVELGTLAVHPNNVNVVRFIPNSSLAFTVSMYQVRIFDLRTLECVRVLQSSGQVVEGSGPTVGSRENTFPILETAINAAEVDPNGRFLFTSFAGDARIWNLEKMASYGRLTGATHSPKSEVSCLASSIGPNGKPIVFTGSRDHYVKMYEITAGGEGLHEPTVEFHPPHYDNVTCVLPYKNKLFTASKDTNIMKFSLLDYKRDHLDVKAHNAYIQAMGIFEDEKDPRLISACREGTVKFYDINRPQSLLVVDEIQNAHSDSINSLATTKTNMFTASSDQTIGVWRRV